MNWTGGSLQRIRKTNGGIIQQQKAYSARARTQLQNESTSPVVPFWPSYLHTSIGRSTVEQDYSASRDFVRLQGQTGKEDLRASSRETGHQGCNIESLKKPLGTCRALDVSNTGLEKTKGITGERSKLERSSPEADPECQLLGINKKRLLRQPDWIGVNPSKPVDLLFLSSRAKQTIGKRRKTEVKPSVTVRRLMTNELANKQSREAVLRQGLQSRMQRYVTDDVRVRVGPDALSVQSTQRNGMGPLSQQSSDPMLFDQETVNARPFEAPELVRPVNHSPNVVSNASQQAYIGRFRGSLTDDQHQRGPKPSSNDAQSLSRYEQEDLTAQQVDVDEDQSEVSLPVHRITHLDQGVPKTLRVSFPNSTSSKDDDRHGIMGDGGSRHKAFHVQTNAHAARTGGQNRVESAVEHPRAKATSVVRVHGSADAEAGKTFLAFLAIPTRDSSHLDVAAESENSVLHLYPTARSHNEAVTNWSQAASQGDRALSSSAVSPSLPSVRRGIVGPALIGQAVQNLGGDSDVQSKKISQSAKEDEKLWQAFVFGSDNTSLSQTMREQDYEQTLSRKAGQTPCVSLSAAVSSLNSPLSTPRRNHWLGNEIQNAANVVPPTSPRQPSSSVIPGMSQLSSEGELCMNSAHRNISLLNDTSCDPSLGPASMFRDTRMVGHSMQRARNRLYSTACPLQYSSSMQALPSSGTSDGNIHLVDPEAEV